MVDEQVKVKNNFWPLKSQPLYAPKSKWDTLNIHHTKLDVHPFLNWPINRANKVELDFDPVKGSSGTLLHEKKEETDFKKLVETTQCKGDNTVRGTVTIERNKIQIPLTTFII